MSEDRSEYLKLEGGERQNGEDDANARRIVACINACKDVPTEWLEKNDPIVLLGPPASETVVKLRDQRDKLATALRTVIDNKDFFHLVVNGHLLDDAQREDLQRSLVKALPAMYDTIRDALTTVPA